MKQLFILLLLMSAPLLSKELDHNNLNRMLDVATHRTKQNNQPSSKTMQLKKMLEKHDANQYKNPTFFDYGCTDNSWEEKDGPVIGFSFTGDDINLGAPNYTFALFSQIPALGVYYDNGYNFRKRKMIIRMTPAMIEIAPDSLKKLLPKNIPIDLYTVISAGVHDAKKDAQDREYNVVFHGFLSSLYKEDATNFIEPIPMGIFDANGVEKAHSNPIAIDTISSTSVYFHAASCSPNNARFKVSNSHKLATFWTMAFLPKNARAAVTYHLLIQDPELEAKIDDILKKTNFKDIIDGLKGLTQKPGSQDEDVLKKFITTMRKIMHKE